MLDPVFFSEETSPINRIVFISASPNRSVRSGGCIRTVTLDGSAYGASPILKTISYLMGSWSHPDGNRRALLNRVSRPGHKILKLDERIRL
jgi:hypothetical protein